MQSRLYRRPGSLLYWCKYEDSRGFPVEHCTGTNSYAEAESIAAQLRSTTEPAPRAAENTNRSATATASRAAENPTRSATAAASRSAQNPTRETKETVADSVTRFVEFARLDRSRSTIQCYEQKGGHLVRLLGSVPTEDLSLDQVSEYCRNRIDEGAARESIRKDLVVLRLSLAHAHDRGITDEDTESLIPKFRAKYKPRRRWLSIEELRGLLRHLPPERQSWVMVAVMTGGRLSEIENLEWGDLDFANAQIHIRGTKTDRSDRIIPMDRELGELLAKMRKGDDRGDLVAGKWSNVRRDLAKACGKARIEPVTPNDLRRTFASLLKQAGRDSLAVGKLLGHSSSRMVELVYGHLDQKSLRQAMEALPSVHSLLGSSENPTS